MALTLQMMNDIPDDLPAWTVRSRRRAGYKLDGEWTRSVTVSALPTSVKVSWDIQ